MTRLPQPVALTLLTRDTTRGRQEVLLGLKLRGFGAGNMVAPGGKLEPGELPVQAAARELQEETGYQVSTEDLTHVATIRFRFPAQPLADMDCQVFAASRFGGELTSNAELRPQWFGTDALPVQRMWQDAARWLPRILEGERFTATVQMATDNLQVDGVDFELW